MIYTHVAGINLNGVNSPIDKMSVDYRFIENNTGSPILQISSNGNKKNPTEIGTFSTDITDMN